MSSSGQFAGGRLDQEYRRLRAALERLTHSAVRTSIRASGKRKFASFHWLESWTEIVDEATQETKGMTITLPLWLYQGILEQGGVLTIHEDYFLLTGGLERWLYRVARKHAGKQPIGSRCRCVSCTTESADRWRVLLISRWTFVRCGKRSLARIHPGIRKKRGGYRGSLHNTATGAADR